MNFPHRALQAGRTEIGAVLAHAMARQAGSATVRAMHFAAPAETSEGDSVGQRIRYFAAHADNRRKPFGPFFARSGTKTPNKHTYESVVYQSASTNFKTTEAKTASPATASLPETAGGSRTI